MKTETFADGSTIETNEATGDRTVCGKLAHDEYLRRLQGERDSAHGGHELIPHLGNDYVDGSTGKRHTSCQLLEDGKAVATLEMLNGKIIGHRTLWFVELPLFFAQAAQLFDNSIPAQFGFCRPVVS